MCASTGASRRCSVDWYPRVERATDSKLHARLAAWLKAAGIKEGPVFRRIIGRGSVTYETKGKGRIGGRLSPEAVARAFKAVARSLKIPAEDIEFISGHSVRVGASQDLLALKLDLGSVMREGRWKTVRMPMRYGEHVMAASGGMARAAREQGETENPVHRNSQHVADPLLATVDGPRHSLAEENFFVGRG